MSPEELGWTKINFLRIQNDSEAIRAFAQRYILQSTKSGHYYRLSDVSAEVYNFVTNAWESLKSFNFYGQFVSCKVYVER